MKLDSNATVSYLEKQAVVRTGISAGNKMVQKFEKCISGVHFGLHTTCAGANEHLKSKLKERFPDYTISLNKDENGVSLLSDKSKIIRDYVTVKQFIATQGESEMHHPFALVEFSYVRLKHVIMAANQKAIVRKMLQSVHLQKDGVCIQIPIATSVKVTKNMHVAIARHILQHNGKAVSNRPKSHILFEYKFIGNEKKSNIDEMTASLSKLFPRFQIIVDAKQVCFKTSDMALMENTNFKARAITKATNQKVRYPTCSVVFEYLYV